MQLTFVQNGAFFQHLSTSGVQKCVMQKLQNANNVMQKCVMQNYKMQKLQDANMNISGTRS